MAKPTGAIQVGGETATNQYYDLSSMDGQVDTDLPYMHAYIIARVAREPSYLNDNGSSNYCATMTHGYLYAAGADGGVTARIKVNMSGQVNITETGPQTTAAWSTDDGVQLTWDEIWGYYPTYKRESSHFGFIHYEFQWIDNGAADTAYVGGVHLSQKFGDGSYSGEPAVCLSRNDAADRHYAHNHFLDAGLGMGLCDTYNAYAAESTMYMDVPIFGNTAA